jgi:CRP-like cAMP-binding protein
MAPAEQDVLIRKLQIAGPLSEADKHALRSAITRETHVKKDVDIICDGDRATSCNVLLSGWVCRYVLLPKGRRQILSFQFPGDIFDAHSFLLQEMDHSIGTLTPCRIGIIPHPTMKRLTEASPRVTRAVWRDTLVDAAIFRAWVTNIGRRSAYQRVAHLICESYLRLDAVRLAPQWELDWPITQSELADATGLTVVHINRTLKQLRDDGLVRIRKSRLTILDWPGLKSAADFDPRYLHLPQTG